MIKIVIIDDEKKITDVIESYLKREGYKVFTAYDGEEGLKLIKKVYPDLLIVDLMLPKLSGEEICREVRKISEIPIIMLTAKSSEDDIVKGIDIGADDYITKPFSVRELLSRIKGLLRRSKNCFVKKREYNNGELEIDFDNRVVKKNGIEISLTYGEYSLLEVLIKKPSKTFTRTEILEIAFDGGEDVFDRLVDTHVKNLRIKIEDDKKNPKYILTVFGVGYKFGGSCDEKNT